ncbi:hypothetical protein [Salibacterium halotolerans]|uniref:DUF3221 domain-containing protein n=1 Tax=Salibacterium halotolerans TaxID=1884432 RepID=A0A1I5XWF5_9BACI|nr:hypothetical protein [Salibacterium halotolerans]SFQ36278.1 hypothetical protein SAMN05518683_13219 [Salibacterium halotolerans]
MKRSMLLFSASILIILSMAACSNESDSTNSGIVFGEVTGKNELQAGNVFQVGEKVNFVMETESPIEQDQLNVILNILSPSDEWQEVTTNTLQVSPDATQVMNGLDASMFEQLGPGAYQLVIEWGDQSVKGDFVVEQSES